MVELAALVMLAAAAAGLYAGWSLNVAAAAHPYAAHVLTVYWGLPVLSVLLVLTAFGLFARRRWARLPALAACFVAPTLLVLALIAFAAGGWMILLLALLGWGGQGGLLKSDPGAVYATALIAAIGIPVALYFSWRLFRHLRSGAVRKEFGDGPSAPADAHLGGVAIAILALVAGLHSHSPMRIDAKSLPLWLRTDGMTVQVKAFDERSDALLATGAMISEDERTIVLAGSFQRFYYLWDIAGGRLERKEAGQLPTFPPWTSFSPDGKRFLSGYGEFFSLATGTKRKLSSIPGVSKRLGFAGEERILLYTGGWPYDTGSLTLMLVDLAADRILYEKVLPGDYGEGRVGHAEPNGGSWSPDRSLYAWHDSRTQRLHILRVATGEIEQFDCQCRTSHLLTFSREADLLYISGEGVSSGRGQFPRGVVFSITDKTFMPGLPFGPVLFASAQENRVVLWNLDEPPSILEYPARRFDAPRWRVPADGVEAAMSPDGRKLILIGRQAPWDVRLAEVAKETSESPPAFRSINSMIGRKGVIKVSARGGVLLLLGSPMAEVLRLGKSDGASPSGSAIDLRDVRPKK